MLVPLYWFGAGISLTQHIGGWVQDLEKRELHHPPPRTPPSSLLPSWHLRRMQQLQHKQISQEDQKRCLYVDVNLAGNFHMTLA